MLMCNVYVCWALLKTSLLADAVSHYMNYELSVTVMWTYYTAVQILARRLYASVRSVPVLVGSSLIPL